MEHQAEICEHEAGELLAHVERQAGRSEPEEEESEFSPLNTEEDRLSSAEREKIESLFDESAADRSKAYEFKKRTRPPRSVWRVREPLSRFIQKEALTAQQNGPQGGPFPPEPHGMLAHR
jgi:hypothetical protein